MQIFIRHFLEQSRSQYRGVFVGKLISATGHASREHATHAKQQCILHGLMISRTAAKKAYLTLEDIGHVYLLL